MGNEASRVDGGAGLSPTTAAAGVRTSSGAKLPTTPLSTPPAARRTQSFSGATGAATPRASLSHSASSITAGSSITSSATGVERTIQRMDRAIRKRVRGGVTYNMRIAVRGARGTGKTSLFQRLKGEPIPETHEPTPQLQSATINWSFRAGSEENVKCEVWDVVDRGFDPLSPPDAAAAPDGAAAEAEGPFELGALQSNSNFASVRASAAVAASIAGAGASGAHTVAMVDATTVDVYHETHGVVFLLDVTRWDTLEYVRQQLEKVPVHIPTLVLGNFRDCGNQRQIFKEDIQDLLYGSSDRSRQQQQQLRRPHELLYFECSLLNCYGLKSLHQYFGIPFLQLKLATIRQQMRIVEGEFSHLKNDLQAKISEQRYSDYVEHIKATGSDIRTGRKAPGGGPALRHAESTIVVNGNSYRDSTNGDADDSERVARAYSNVSTGSDIVVPMERVNSAEESPEPAAATSALSPRAVAAASTTVTSAENEHQVSEAVQKDLEDLPERTNSLADMMTASLKFEHSASSSSLKEELQVQSPVPSAPPVINKPGVAVNARGKASSKSTSSALQENGSKPSNAAAASIDEPMSLEDFQVPKQKNNDLDSFYSDDDSDASGESDEDVIIPPSAALLAKKHNHKQQFIYSDSSDSDDDRSARRAVKAKNSPRRGRRVATKANKSAPAPTDASLTGSTSTPSAEATTVGSDSVKATESATSADTGSPVRAPPKTEQQPQSSASPKPPSVTQSASPTTTAQPISPAARTSRSPRSRQKLESSHSHTPRASSTPTPAHQVQLDTSSVAGASVDENEQVEQEPETCGGNADAALDTAIMSDAVVVTSKPESPVGRISPRHRVQSIENSPSASPRVAEAVSASHTDDASDADELKEEKLESLEKKDENKGEVSASASAPLSSAVADMTTNGELDYVEEDDHVVVSDDMEKFFSDDDEDEETPPAMAEPAESVERDSAAPASSHGAKSISKRAEMLMNDDEEEDEGGSVAHGSVVASPGIQDKNGHANGSIRTSRDERVSESDFVPDVNESKVADSFFSDDEEDAAEASSRVSRSPEHTAVLAPPTKTAHRQKQRPNMANSDDDSDSASEESAMVALRPTLSALQPRTTVQTSSRSPLSPRTTSEPPRDELDAFFSESDSASEASPRAMFPAHPASGSSSVLKAPKRHMVARSDDDDDEEEGEGRGGSKAVDRFASYNAKLVRKSKAERRQEREEIRRMTASLSSSRNLDTTAAPVATTVAGTASADVLAAIRAAQEEALRMLPPSSGPGSDDGDEKKKEKEKKKKHKASKVTKSSSRSSEHRHQQSDDVDASVSSKRRSSNKSSSSSSRSSRRREM